MFTCGTYALNAVLHSVFVQVKYGMKLYDNYDAVQTVTCSIHGNLHGARKAVLPTASGQCHTSVQ